MRGICFCVLDCVASMHGKTLQLDILLLMKVSIEYRGTARTSSMPHTCTDPLLCIWSHRISIIPLLVTVSQSIIDFSLWRFKSLKKSLPLSWVCPFPQSPREEEALHYKIKFLTHPVLLIAADLQIICIDQSRDVAECRADSKIPSI